MSKLLAALIQQPVNLSLNEIEEKIMNRYQIAVIVGSLRKDSFNRSLANAIAQLAPSEFTFKHLDIANLPLYNQCRFYSSMP